MGISEERRAYQRKYYQENRERLLAEQRERSRRNYEKNKPIYAARGRRSRLKKYGLTEIEFAELLEAQDHECPICERIMNPPVVDHDHETGEVRGLLCKMCNTAIGLLREDTWALENAIEYLTRSSSGATSTPSSEPSRTLFDAVD